MQLISPVIIMSTVELGLLTTLPGSEKVLIILSCFIFCLSVTLLNGLGLSRDNIMQTSPCLAAYAR